MSARALVDLIRVKGGRSERDYVARYLAHPKLDAALRQRGRAQGEDSTTSGVLHRPSVQSGR